MDVCQYIGGASNITTYIPENCFIDYRKFNSKEEMYDFLKNITEDEYQTYIENARTFLQSDKAKLFTKEKFIKTFEKAVGIYQSEPPKAL